MAGVKRKLDTAHGSAATATTNTSTMGTSSRDSAGDDTSNIRVTRSLRSSRDARASQNDNSSKSASHAPSGGANSGYQNSTSYSNNSAVTNKQGGNRPSRIITLYTRKANGTNNASHISTASTTSTPSVVNSTRETRNSRSRAANLAPVPAPPLPPASAPAAASQVDGAASISGPPETPRPKRVKRGSVAEETPSRTTRQSARLRAQVYPALDENTQSESAPASKQIEASPSAIVAPTPSTRTRNRSRQLLESVNEPPILAAPVVKSPPPENVVHPVAEPPKPLELEPSQDLKDPSSAIPESPKGTVVHDNQEFNNEPPDPEPENVKEPSISTRSSPLASRKRKSSGSEDRGPTLSTRASSSPSKKPKVEDGELDREPAPQLQNGTESTQDVTPAPTDIALESKIDNGSRQLTEEVEESTPDNATESTIAKTNVRTNRNRGRGRGARNRASARFASNRRGRGGTRSARGGRGRQYDRSSDVELGRSPSPSAATQKLRDRQRELDKAFRKVAAAQRLALAVLATQSEKRIARDKNAHKVVPEYEDINLVLKASLREKQEILRQEYELKVAQENRLFDANKEVVEERFRECARYIQEEHLLASQGEYMTFIEGRRAAEDDEHTETDGSDSDTDRGRVAPPSKEVFRGFNSSCVRAPSGAAAYERAAFGWEDFVQRAKLGDDIDPQMKEMREVGPFAGLSAEEIIKLLLEATGIVPVRPNAAVPTKEITPPTYTDVRALSALADAAAAEPHRPPLSQATPRLSTHRTLLPQPSQAQLPHGPPEPRPFVLPPPTPQRGQPRRLLPAGQQIPPINEQLGLPDPFAARGGPPQLPPPPGSNFQRPTLPGFLQHRPQSLYYPPPPPAGPPPPGPRAPY